MRGMDTITISPTESRALKGKRRDGSKNMVDIPHELRLRQKKLMQAQIEIIDGKNMLFQTKFKNNIASHAVLYRSAAGPS